MADDGIGPGTFCARIGIPERRLTDYLSGEAKHVTVYVVDRALCRDGGWHLSQLYPDLYPDASPDLVGLLQAVGDIAAREAWELDHIDERTAA